MSAPETLKYFLKAEKFAVIGRVMNDRSRWDNKILRWYQQRKFPVVAVRPDKPIEEIEGLKLLNQIDQIQNLNKTSISIIINPKLGLTILKILYPIPSIENEPRSIWFQPGADDELIWEYVKERNLKNKVIGKGSCIYRDGDNLLNQIKKKKRN